VHTTQPGDWHFGQVVEVVGKLDISNQDPVLRNALARPLQSAADGLPLPDSPGAKVLQPGNAYQGKLITLDLRLIGYQRGLSGEDTLILSMDGGLICGRLKQAAAAPPWNPPIGALLRATGVCVVRGSEVFGPLPAAFRAQLLLRSTADITVLKGPPFWTGKRLLWLFGSAIGGGLLALAWIIILRRQVNAQTSVIGHQLEQQAVHVERARLARELHDTLQQHFIALGMHVQAAAAECRRAPDVAAQMLDSVNAMLRHSHTETRRSVWNLRNEILERRGLEEALKELRQCEPGGTAVRITSSGVSRRLPSEVEFHLLRIAQEAVANALQHAGASRVDVVLCYSEQSVELCISDDGAGFEPAQLASMQDNHFGVLGMQERAEKINSQLQIESAPGRGATIKVQVKSPLSVALALTSKQT
jgi:signal transduction histidine kinase